MKRFVLLQGSWFATWLLKETVLMTETHYTNMHILFTWNQGTEIPRCNCTVDDEEFGINAINVSSGYVLRWLQSCLPNEVLKLQSKLKYAEEDGKILKLTLDQVARYRG